MGLFTRNQKGEAAPSGRGSREGRTGGQTVTRRKNGAAGRDDAVADDLRRCARRRLIGAVAMVLAAVIVLPMVLDSERETLPDDIAIQIPSRNTPFQQDLVAVAPPADPAAGSLGAPIAPAPPPAPSATPAPATPDARVPASLATVTPVTPSTPAPREETKPPPKPREPERAAPAPETPPPAPVRNTPPNAAAAQKEAEAARALALLQGKTVPAPTPAPRANSSRFAVQVVAVRSRDGADALLKQLRGAGLAGYIETIKTPDGQVHRVRLGPFDSRGQAESAQAKLRGLPGGYSGSLVPL